MGFFKNTVNKWISEYLGSTTITEESLQSKMQQAYIKEMALYTAVSLIADIISECERKVYEDGELKQNGNWYRLNVHANPNQSGNDLIHEWVMNFYYHGDALMVPLGKYLYVASDFAVEEYPIRGNVFQSIAIEHYGIYQTFDASKVYYIKQDNPEVRKLLNGIFDTYNDLLEYAEKSYGRNAGEKYVLNTGAYPSGDAKSQKEYIDMVTERLKPFIESEAGVFPATRDQKLERVSAGNGSASSDYTSLRKDVYDIVASALHIPVNLLDGNITSVDAIINQTLTMAIDPLARKISEELTRKTYTEDEILRGSKILVDTTAVKHLDVVDMAEKVDKLIASGVLSIDETRERCNLPLLGEEWSQAHYLTKNYEGLDQAEEGGDEE